MRKTLYLICLPFLTHQSLSTFDWPNIWTHCWVVILLVCIYTNVRTYVRAHVFMYWHFSHEERLWQLLVKRPCFERTNLNCQQYFSRKPTTHNIAFYHFGNITYADNAGKIFERMVTLMVWKLPTVWERKTFCRFI